MSACGWRVRVAASLLCSAAALGCGPSGPDPKTADAADATAGGTVLTEEKVRAIVERTAAARSLPEKRPVQIELVGPEAFRLMVREHLLSDEPSLEAERQAAARLLGFGLLPPEGKGPAPATMQEVLEEQVVGFYNRDKDRVFVPRGGVKTEKEAIIRDGVLAHEVHHALQHQHFELAELSSLSTEDERLALLALVEGDATVAMAAYLGSAYGAPLRRTLRRVTDVTKEVPIENLAHNRDRAPQLVRALPIARAKLLFPYLDGASFVTDLFRAGGFALINRAYQSPPVSTEQVLHPEKYIAGELPVPVRAPQAPPGYQAVEDGRMGELQTRVVLSSCVDAETAAQAARGWGGDAYATAMDSDGRVTLLWATVWDTERDAKQFERVLKGSPDCFGARDLRAEKRAYSIGANQTVRRAGNRVAFARGLKRRRLALVAQQLLQLPQPPVPAQPLGEYTIAARKPLPDPQPGHLKSDVFRSDWMGIYCRVPSGLVAKVSADPMELELRRAGTPIIGGLYFSDRITNPEFIDIAFREVHEAVARAVGPHRLVPTTRRRTKLALGSAIEQFWNVAGSSVQVRMVMLPVCAGTGSYIFVLAYGDDYARSVLEGWLRSFRWLRNANAPACEFLDPK